MHEIVEIGAGYWSIRGDFKIAGLLNVGTQAALVKLSDGRFVMLDSYTLDPEVLAEVARITGGTDRVAAILNLHPFHTLHCEAMHRQFPAAKLYGTARHKARFPDLPWEPLVTEDPALWPAFAPDLDFTVPPGVAFIPENENLHFASVLAYHRPSGTIHVDDTFTSMPPGPIGRALGRQARISFHMTLPKVLEPRAGAVADFRAWAERLAEDWGDARHLCAAHNAVLDVDRLGADSFADAMRDALARVEPKLKAHAATYG